MNPMLKIAAGAVFTVSSVFAGAGALNHSTAQAAPDYDGNCYASGGLFYCTYSSENGIKHVKKTGTLVDQQVTIWDETYDHCPKEVTIGGWGDHISALAPMTLHVETCDGSGGNMHFHGVGDGGDDRGGSLRVATPRDTGDREPQDDGRSDADRDRDKDQREEEPRRETDRGREDEPRDTGSRHREPHRGDADNDDATNDEPRERNAPATPPPSQPQLRSSDSPSQGGQLKSLVFRHVDLDADPGIRASSVPTPHIDDLIASGLVGTAVAGCWEPECGGGEVPRKFVSPSCLYLPMASKLLPWCAGEIPEIDEFQTSPEPVTPWKGVKVAFPCGINTESGTVSYCTHIAWSPDPKPPVDPLNQPK